MKDTTTKEKVQSSYPNARCFMYNHRYAIMEISSELYFQISNGQLFSEWPKLYSGWFYTSIEAWNDAWKLIQKKYLDKLET